MHAPKYAPSFPEDPILYTGIQNNDPDARLDKPRAVNTARQMLRPVVLAGNLSSAQDQNSLTQTLDCLNRSPWLEKPVIITTRADVGTASSIAKETDCQGATLIALSRNLGSTAASLTAAYHVSRASLQERLLLVPPHTQIGDEATFMRSVANIARQTATAHLVTLLVESGKPIGDQLMVHLGRSLKSRGWFAIRKRFEGKDNDQWSALHETGACFTSNGFSVINTRTLLDLGKRHIPETVDMCSDAFLNGKHFKGVSYPAYLKGDQAVSTLSITQLLAKSEMLSAYPCEFNLRPRFHPVERQRLESIFGNLQMAG